MQPSICGPCSLSGYSEEQTKRRGRESLFFSSSEVDSAMRQEWGCCLSHYISAVRPAPCAKHHFPWLAELLNDGRRGTLFTVRPVVVFPEWFIECRESCEKSDVWVLNPKALGGFLDHQPCVLSAELIDTAAHVLTAWEPSIVQINGIAKRIKKQSTDSRMVGSKTFHVACCASKDDAVFIHEAFLFGEGRTCENGCFE